MRSTLLALVFGAIAGWAGMAQSAPIVANGDFETGDFTGWTVSPSANILITPVAIAGNFSASLGDVSASPGSLSQTLTTTPGTLYAISFLLQNQDTAQSNAFTVMFGSDIVFSETNALSDPSPVAVTVFDTALSGSTLLSFIDTNDQSDWLLDDVTVNVAAVPEPSAALLVFTAVAGVLAAARRRRARS
ncbi:MAG TPA: PEP-CTERM sorting domain-containing protein [Stellaceae bacterium]|nr:PEP-CTERM sorting domain-containing protein [Stellaceae bacterium]